MSEAKKLTDHEFMNIRESDAASYLVPNSLAVLDRHALLGHIDAITAEHEAAMTRAREDADRVGAARMAFEDQQQKRIEALETELNQLRAVAQEAVDWHTRQRDYHVTIMKLRDALDRDANGPG